MLAPPQGKFALEQLGGGARAWARSGLKVGLVGLWWARSELLVGLVGFWWACGGLAVGLWNTFGGLVADSW